ncbi:MAG: phospholipid scramblase-related protein [Acidimicrobiia bacterium]|nr:phospholipid scramblase-related protein [Acidimicrobiia bacterium]MDH5519534.1 phospholipid scramblase-related protein [Acidimicrobiia bacterium]
MTDANMPGTDGPPLGSPSQPTSSAPAPDWYPDPMGRHEYRYWDGNAWTDHVASHGRQSTDPVTSQPPKTVIGQQTAPKIQTQVDKHLRSAAKRGAPTESAIGGTAPGPAGGGLLDQPILVINQKWKFIEVNNEFAIYDTNGNQIGAVRQVGQSTLKKIVRFLGDVDQYFTHKYQVVDASGTPQLLITRPAKIFKSRVIVQDGMGAEVGQIIQRNVFGKIRFGFEVGGQDIGGIFAENWRAWNFSIKDANGTEVARVTKTFEGLLKTTFTTADNYVLQVHQQLPDPLRLMVYASAVTIDTALKQDARGLNTGSVLNVFDG